MKADERILESVEMRMLRWIGGISLHEHRTNDDIRRFMKVTKITLRTIKVAWTRNEEKTRGTLEICLVGQSNGKEKQR